jgi:chorismate mutase
MSRDPSSAPQSARPPTSRRWDTDVTDQKAPPDISSMRARIDEIDATFLELWQERAELSHQIGALRRAAGGTRLALHREQEIMQRFRQRIGPDGTQLAMLILRAGRGPL